VLGIFELESHFLYGMASNLNPPDLCLLNH
jgi:hypothetical protein